MAIEITKSKALITVQSAFNKIERLSKLNETLAHFDGLHYLVKVSSAAEVGLGI